VLLIFFGGQVKSTESGLSVPDWPNTYGHFMFTFPYEQWVGGVFWEHSHRLIASAAGLFTVILTVWTLRVDTRRIVRLLALTATSVVVVQGIFGGLTVLLMLPAWTSIVHGTLAQIYLCVVAAIAVMTSRTWIERAAHSEPVVDHRLRSIAFVATMVIVVQLFVGAVMRHTEAGLAIPDIPTMFGSWLPPLSDESLRSANRELWEMNLHPVDRWQILSHLLHRIGGVAVAVAIAVVAARAYRSARTDPWLMRPAVNLVLLVVVQLTLGILVILTHKHFIITSAHVTVGALTLLTSFVLMIRTRQPVFAAPSLNEARPGRIAKEVPA